MMVHNDDILNLSGAVNSILDQTFTDFIFIIINDGSEYKSLELLKSFDDSRINIINHDYLGITKSLNNVLKELKSEYIALMDQDEISLPSRLESQVKILDNNKRMGLLGVKYVYSDENNIMENDCIIPVGSINVRNCLMVRNPFCFGSMIIRNSILDSVGYFDEDINIIKGYDLWLKISHVSDVDIIDEVLQKRIIKNGVNIVNEINITNYPSIDKLREKYVLSFYRKHWITVEDLYKIVRSNPNDRIMAKIFIDIIEGGIDLKNVEYQLVYLQLKYFYSDNKWDMLNKIGNIYLDQDKYSLAQMCFIESLSMNSDQYEYLDLVEKIQKYSVPKCIYFKEAYSCKVSVIVPTYNRINEIKECIGSILNQTYEDYEIIVINDGGTDDVKKVIDNYNSNKIKYIKNIENKGLSGALNVGIKFANGKYIAYLDDDDVYYSNHLEMLVEFMENNPAFDCVYSNAWWCYGEIQDNKFLQHSKKLLKRRPKEYSNKLLLEYNYISTLNMLHKKECFRHAGVFNEDLGKLMDWDLWLRFSRLYKFKQIDQITGEYRWKQNNMSFENELEINFLYNILKNYNNKSGGSIVLIYNFIKNNDIEKAYSYFEDIVRNSNYNRDSVIQMKELFHIAAILNNKKGNVYYKKIYNEYLQIDRENCIKDIIKMKQYRLILRFIDIVLPFTIKILLKRLRLSIGKTLLF